MSTEVPGIERVIICHSLPVERRLGLAKELLFFFVVGTINFWLACLGGFCSASAPLPLKVPHDVQSLARLYGAEPISTNEMRMSYLPQKPLPRLWARLVFCVEQGRARCASGWN